MDETKLYIILGVVLGTLVLTGVAVAVLFCVRRNKSRVRGFSLRAPTPLDDAEFESWRRPSEHTEKHGIRSIQPVVVQDRYTPTMFEKELVLYDHPRTPSPDSFASPLQSPSSSIRKPERVRRKSSVTSSIADRPPTPYSPTSNLFDSQPTSNHFDFQRESMSSRRSQPSSHHPTKSEASAFRFEFAEFETQQTRPERWV
jgi:hypothetical protein